jgi:HSP20 family protein
MYVPHIDVCEHTDEVVILVEMPGVDRADVRISWKDNVLTIAGVKRQRADVGVARYLCVERTYGPFRRDISIATPIDQRKARAELKNGLMRIHLPRVADDRQLMSIPID